MPGLRGKKVIIVGASSGIGLATAKRAASCGAEVWMLSRSSLKLERASSEIIGLAHYVAVDMLDEEAIAEAFNAAAPFDHVVATAVTDELSAQGAITDITNVQVEYSFRKLRGYVNIVRAAVPRIRDRGSITLLSGAGAQRAPLGMSLLSAANAAVAAFGKALAFELAPIRVNVVMPGPVDTALHGLNRETVKTWAESLPARHFAQPEEIAEAIAFLISNSSMTGHALVIDGGYLIS
jgi:NAD(P)-dependent dehydrogenase (short-subunit alcohol dehydrogenase family)